MAVAAVAVTGVGAYLGYDALFKPAATRDGEGGASAAPAPSSGGGLLSAIGLKTGADDLLEEMADGTDAVHGELAGIRDAASRDAAMGRIQETVRGLLQIDRRLPDVALTATPADLKAAEKERHPRLTVQRLESEMERIRQTDARSPELDALIGEVVLILKQLRGSITAVGPAPNEPSNDFERIEYDSLLIKRDACQALAGFRSEADAAGVAEKLVQASHRLSEVKSRKEKLARLDVVANQARQTYLAAEAGLDQLQSRLLGLGVSEIGAQDVPPVLNQAYADYRSAESNVDFAQPLAQAPTDPANVAPPAGATVQPGIAAARPVGGGIPFPGTSGNSPDAKSIVRVRLDGGAFIPIPPDLGAAERQKIIDQRPKALMDLQSRLQKLIGKASIHVRVDGSGRRVAEVGYSGDVAELAEKIDFVKVSDVDPAARSFTLTFEDIDQGD